MGLTVSASAPGRCGIVGNPSDIYGGKVLSCSVAARATCTVTVAGQEDLPEDRRLWNAAVKRLNFSEPVRVGWHTAIPRSSGLSGSTALLAATVACLSEIKSTPLNLATPDGRIEAAELIRDIERYEAQVMCGYQDAYMIVHGGLQLMDFAGKHPAHSGPKGTIRPVEGDTPFLLVTTGVERLSGAVHGPMAERWLRGELGVVAAIDRISELADSAAHAIQTKDWTGLSKLMKENHDLIASIGGSGEAIDRLISDCLTHGASAAKLAGAGLGGTVIALADDVDDLQLRLSRHGYSRFLHPTSEPGLRIEFPQISHD